MWVFSWFEKPWKVIAREKQAKREELITEGTKGLSVTESDILEKSSPLFVNGAYFS